MLKFLQRWVQEGKADEPVIETVEPQPPKLGLQLTADGFTGRPMPVVEFTGTLHCFVDGCDGWVEFKAGRGQCSRCQMDQNTGAPGICRLA